MLVLNKISVDSLHSKFSKDTKADIFDFAMMIFSNKTKLLTVGNLVYAIVTCKYGLSSPYESDMITADYVLYTDATRELKAYVESMIEEVDKAISVNSSKKSNDKYIMSLPTPKLLYNVYEMLDPMPHIDKQVGYNCGYYAVACTADFYSTWETGTHDNALPARKRDRNHTTETSLRQLRTKCDIEYAGPVFKLSQLQKVIALTGCHSTIINIHSHDDFMSIIKTNIDNNKPLIIPFNNSVAHGTHALAKDAHWATIVGYEKSTGDILLAQYGLFTAIQSRTIFRMFNEIGPTYSGGYFFKDIIGGDWECIESGSTQSLPVSPVKQFCIPATDLSEFRRKLIVVEQERFLAPEFYHEKIHNAKDLCRALRILPLKSTKCIAFAEQYQDKIVSSEDLANVLKALKVDDINRLAFARQFSNRITNNSLDLVLQQLAIVDRYDFACLNEAKISDIEDLIKVLSTLELTHRMAFVRRHKDKINNYDDLCILMQFLDRQIMFGGADVQALLYVNQHMITNGVEVHLMLKYLNIDDRLLFVMIHLNKIESLKEIDKIKKEFTADDQEQLLIAWRDQMSEILSRKLKKALPSVTQHTLFTTELRVTEGNKEKTDDHNPNNLNVSKPSLP